MSDRRFTLDTNLLFCAADSQAGHRQRLALEVLDRARHLDCWLTIQCLAEFFHSVTRKGAVSRPAAAAQVRDWSQVFPTAGHSLVALDAALEMSGTGKASFWDALLLATAAEAGCQVVLSEDMAHGHRLGKVVILKLFTDAGFTPEAARLLGVAS